VAWQRIGDVCNEEREHEERAMNVYSGAQYGNTCIDPKRLWNWVNKRPKADMQNTQIQFSLPSPIRLSAPHSTLYLNNERVEKKLEAKRIYACVSISCIYPVHAFIVSAAN
jgi:hypothetical protein